MRFEYKRYDLERGAPIERPVILIVLRNVRDPGTPAIAYEALVDSGSDRNMSIGVRSGPRGSASKRDPHFLRFERLALSPSELVGVAETGRARVGV
jgi:hypothetical protein